MAEPFYSRPVPKKCWRALRCMRSRLNSKKIFVIGRNKSGTTSVEAALRDLGFNVAPQRPFELLLYDWAENRWDRLIRYCRWFDAFQDIPFSLPRTYRILDKAFPGSKFILSIRDSSEQWYRSLVKFQSVKFGNGSRPTWNDLENAKYCKKGFMADCARLVYQASPDQLYDRSLYIRNYESHNSEVIEYFKNRPNDLLIIDVASPDSYQRFCQFLGRKPLRETFPWENRTQNSDVSDSETVDSA